MNTTKYIPKNMEKLNNWCYWNLEKNSDGRITKIPKNCKTLGNAQPNNPSTWMSIEYARANFKRSGFTGIAFMLPLDKSITMIDLDHCVEDGKINDFAQEIVNMFPNTYIELSQSQTGIHIFCYGTVPKNLKIDKIEMYSSVRFCATTGQAIRAKEISNYQKEINILYEKYKKKEPSNQDNLKEYNTELSVLDIVEIIRKSRNSSKFDYYYRHAEANSENTLGLASLLAFYCQKDRQKMKEIMYSSTMSREKFNRPTNGSTWLDYVIDVAIETTTEVYEPKSKNQYEENSLTEQINKIEKVEENEIEQCFLTAKKIKKIDENDLKMVKSKFTMLDKKIRGFIFGELSVWSGLNGSGKTNILLQLILNFALQGYQTMLFSRRDARFCY